MKTCRTLTCLTFLIFSLTQLVGGPNKELDQLQPFLEQHCISCHGPKKQKNDIRFDVLSHDLTDIPTLETWQGVLDQLNLGEMPPEDEPQPKQEEIDQVIKILTAQLKLAYAQQKSTGAQTVIRRLNRDELRNTLRDLLYLNGAAYAPGQTSRLVDNNGNGRVERTGNDPVRMFPDDEEEHGFRNIGNRLVMSDFLLKLTLGAAQESLDAATHTGPKPDTSAKTYGGHIMTGKQYGQQTLETISREFNPDFDMLVQGYQRSGRLTPVQIRRGVAVSAKYRITIEASAHNPDNPWPDLVKLDAENPFQISLSIADTANGGISGPTSTMLSKWNVPPDGKKHSYTFETWIDDTWTPWVGWEAGPYDRAFRAEKIVEQYYPEKFTPRPDKKEVEKEVYEAWPLDMARLLIKDGYKGPHIRIYSIKLEPLIQEWPPRSHTALYGDGKGKLNIEDKILNFAQRAYRQPIQKNEVSRYIHLAKSLMGDEGIDVGGVISDLKFKLYKGEWSKLPNFKDLTPIKEGTLAEGLIDIRAANLPDFYSMLFTGKLEVPTAGEHEFSFASDDGCRLLVNGKKVVEHDGLHGASWKKGKIHLSEGVHNLRVEYLAYGNPNSLRVAWSGPKFPSTPLSADSNSRKQMVVSNPDTAKKIKALQAAYMAILCSPRFLYIQEKGEELNNYEIANRLSYFLWSSMPDDQLFKLAESGKLKDKSVILREVDRMLKDQKAKAFVHNFTVTWLRLDKLGKMPPERGGPFRFYHDRRVEPMMVDQAVAYVKDVLQNNKTIQHFIDSDYTYMNQTLAEWIYQRKDIQGGAMRKVKLDDPRRGGLFTQPGVMTATSNGVDTTPVVRGVWVLENILGTPPSPPPPDVEPLSPDLRGAKTIREQLDIHRNSEACNGCHRKIDPLGFPFENFDPVGRWRDHYLTKPRLPIDPATTLSNGKEVKDIVAFKKILLERETDIARCLTEKMLTYATGRILEPVDRGEINRIVEELGKKENRFRELVNLVATSKIFLSK
jgi:hypothetical protein